MVRYIRSKEELENLLRNNHYFSREWRCYRKLIVSKSVRYRKRLLKALVKKLSRKNVFISLDLIEELLEPKGLS